MAILLMKSDVSELTWSSLGKVVSFTFFALGKVWGPRKRE